MTTDLGFILLTHKEQGQIRRLVNRLNVLFGYPPIAIHHDQSKSKIEKSILSTGNVELVLDYSKTGWGEFGVLDGLIKALQLMRTRWGLPKWIFLLSESCYPIKPATAFYAHLENTSFDAHIHHEIIDSQFFQREWHQLCHARYCTHKDNPFGILFPCYAGELWFHANKKAIESLLNFHERNPLLAHYYKNLQGFHSQRKLVPAYEKAGGVRVANPEESYIHTILCNDYSLAVSPSNYRFIDWDAKGVDLPRTLTCQDFGRLMESSALIARKFDEKVDTRILDMLDN